MELTLNGNGLLGPPDADAIAGLGLESADSASLTAAPPSVDYVADPEQIVTIHRLLGVMGVLVVIILAQAALNLVLYWRKPDTLGMCKK